MRNSYDPTVDSVESAIEMYHRTRNYGEAAPFEGGEMVVTKHKDGTEKVQIKLPRDNAKGHNTYDFLYGANGKLISYTPHPTNT